MWMDNYNFFSLSLLGLYILILILMVLFVDFSSVFTLLVCWYLCVDILILFENKIYNSLYFALVK